MIAVWKARPLEGCDQLKPPYNPYKQGKFNYIDQKINTPPTPKIATRLRLDVVVHNFFTFFEPILPIQTQYQDTHTQHSVIRSKGFNWLGGCKYASS